MTRHVSELLAIGVPDLHPRNVPGRFEWFLCASETERSIGVENGVSEAVYGDHPFCSVWVVLRQSARSAGVTPRSARVEALASAHFLPWKSSGHPRNAVHRSLNLALRIAPLARALALLRVWPCFEGHPVPTAAAIRTLTAMLLDDQLDSDA